MFSAVSASAGTAENGAPRQNARQKDLVRSMKAKRKAYDGWYNRYWKRVLDDNWQGLIGVKGMGSFLDQFLRMEIKPDL